MTCLNRMKSVHELDYSYQMTIASTLIRFSCKMLFTYHSAQKILTDSFNEYKHNNIQCRYVPTPNLKVARPEKHENLRIKKYKNIVKEYRHGGMTHFSPSLYILFVIGLDWAFLLFFLWSFILHVPCLSCNYTFIPVSLLWWGYCDRDMMLLSG